MNEVNIRPITAKDNAALAFIVRNALKEFKADKQGTVYFDESTDHLFELFQQKKSAYNVIEINGKLLGGAGIYPTAGLPDDTCELVKMYLAPEARGKGFGKQLLQKSSSIAKEFGFAKIYLESMPELATAIGMYQKNGFTALQKPLGNSGHSGCDIWMIKIL